MMSIVRKTMTKNGFCPSYWKRVTLVSNLFWIIKVKRISTKVLNIYQFSVFIKCLFSKKKKNKKTQKNNNKKIFFCFFSLVSSFLLLWQNTSSFYFSQFINSSLDLSFSLCTLNTFILVNVIFLILYIIYLINCQWLYTVSCYQVSW